MPEAARVCRRRISTYPRRESLRTTGIEHGSRRLVHFNITQHPTADWTLQQLREAIGCADAYRYLLHDRDNIIARSLDESIKNLGITVLKSPRTTRRPTRSATGDRNDSTRVFGAVDSVIAIPLAMDPEVLGGSLQPRTPIHGAGSGCPRSSIRGRAPSGSTIPASNRRAHSAARQIDSRRLASRIFARARIRLIGMRRITGWRGRGGRARCEPCHGRPRAQDCSAQANPPILRFRHQHDVRALVIQVLSAR